MKMVRVLLGNRPRMLRESLRGTLESESGFEVELVEPEPVEVLEAVERTAADVVVITLPDSGEDPGLASLLLTEYPDLLVIALSGTDDSAFLYRQVITKEELSPVSESSLLDAIRRRRQERLPIVSQRTDRHGRSS